MESPDHQRSALPLHDFLLADWLVEPRLNRISRDGADVHLRPQLMDLLVFLAGHQGAVVTKDQILDAVWPQQYIAESGLARCIAELRVLLGDEAKDSRCIQTIHKRGYRLIAEVRDVEAKASVSPAAPAAPALAAVEPPAASVSQAPPDEPAATARVEIPTAEPGDIRPSAVSDPAVAPSPPASIRPRLVRWAAISAFPIVALVAFFVWTWSSGIAPALAARDTVLLADVVNRTGDTVFDGTLKLALAVQLEQSPFLKLVADEQVRSTLRLMEREPDTALVGAVARELCERSGAKALIAGSIAPLGGHYAIGIEAVACRTGETLARELAEADSKDRVLESIGLAASRLRVKLGETLPSVEQYDVPIAQATTASIDALKAFSRGEAARDAATNSDDWRQVMAWYEEAIRFDPAFAMAHARLGTVLRYTGEYEQARQAYRRAYDLRDRITDPERFYIESHYHFNITGDIDRGNQVLELWKRTYPSAYVPRYNLAFDHLANGRIPRGIEEAREAVAIAPRVPGAIGLLVSGLMAAGELDQAATILNDALDGDVMHPALSIDLLRLSLARGDQHGIDRATQLMARTPEGRLAAGVRRASAEMAAGRCGAGRSAYRGVRERARLDNLPSYEIDLWEAFDEALLGNQREARTLLQALPTDRRDRGFLAVVAHTMVRAGNVEAARRLLDDLVKSQPLTRGPRSLVDDVTIPMAQALLLAADGRIQEAIRAAHELSQFELWPDAELEPVLARADIHMAAGQFALAEAAYRKVLEHPGAALNSLAVPSARLGAARSAARAGRPEVARQAYDDFLRAWANADPGLPMIAQAQKERAALGRR